MRSEAEGPGEDTKAGAHLALPPAPGPHEDDVAQGRESTLACQWGVCLTAWLSFSVSWTASTRRSVTWGSKEKGVAPAPNL